jgi:hypothetical protein
MISLQELSLEGNAMADHGSGAAARIAAKGLAGSSGMAASTGIEYVDALLKRLHLTEKRVSPRLLLNNSLRTLSLASSEVSDRTIEDLARVLASHKGIQHLALQQNQLADQAAFALAGLVRCSHSLRSINMADNAVSDEGGLALCTALAAPASNVSFLSLRVNQCGPASAAAVLHALAVKRDLHVDFSGNTVPWVLYSKVAEQSARNRRVWEASLSSRFREEYETLQARHEHRLQVEDQCLDSIEDLSALQSTLATLEAELPVFKDKETAETRAAQAEFEEWNHRLHEAHAAEQRTEGQLSAHSKDLEGKIAALRKGIEKEQRFIAQAEKLIPAALEERSAEELRAEADVVDLKRDLRLLTGERNEQVEACELALAELRRLVRDMEGKSGSGKKKGKSGAAGGAGRPSSRGRNRSRTPSPRKSPRGTSTSRPGTASKPRKATASAAAAAASASPTGSSSRPPSARRPASSKGSKTKSAAAAPSSAAVTSPAAAGAKKASASAAKPKAAATPSKPSPSKGKKKGTTPKATGRGSDLSGATSPEPVLAASAAAAGDSSLVALAQAQAADP